LRDIITTAFRYNSWAMGQLFTVALQLTPAQFTQTEASGNGTIRDTLVHMMSVQWGYFSWFDQSVSTRDALARVRQLRGPMFATTAIVYERWKEIDRQTRTLSDRVDDEQLRTVWQWNLPDGRSLALPLWQLMMHVYNHQVHTRGQVVAAVRRAGLAPQVSEFLLFAIQQAGQENE
jgi:uncharacterized damage-inducible protein DinB